MRRIGVMCGGRGFWPRAPVLVFLFVLVLVSTTFPGLAASAASAASATSGQTQTEMETASGVLLITLDTFRGDRIGVSGASGAGGVPTPNLDRLAEGGVVFTRARSPVPITLPAHASILTGLLPPEHGVRDNGSFRLAPEHTTLAERLSEKRFRTAAFVGSFVLDHRFGLAQGFDHYDDVIVAKAEALESPEAERPGEAVLTAFADWLRGLDPADRWFAWVHLYDPHAPYVPPQPFRSRHASDPYGGEIAYTDFVVGRLMEELEARDLRSRTLVAAVGDHGEGLGEHDEDTHALLIYNSTLHVPMILNGPGVPSGRKVTGLVRTIDLAPTLLDLVGDGAGLGSGVSLRRQIEDDVTGAPPLEAYSESLYGRLHLGWAPLHGLETERFRLIRAPTPELFDLSRDPHERENRAAIQPRVTRQLDERLAGLEDGMTGNETAVAGELDDETRARLESLGYLTARTEPTAGAETESTDPKAHMETYRLIQRAHFLGAQGDCRAVIRDLEPLLEQKISLVFERLGACYMAQKAWPEARRVFRDALESGLELPLFHLNLGIIALRQGRVEEAEKEIRIALVLDETSVVAHYHLGDVLRARRRDREALDAYRKALALNPRYVFAWNGLGMTLARLGRNDEAVEAFGRVVDFDPEAPRGHFNLAALYERMGRREQALESYRRFLATSTERDFAGERARVREAIRRLESPR